ncbi:methyltransferase domain-containing protein [Mesorhizobium sp. M0323]|uniref:class I SAM-dependent methyltransferase n=1 Tax=Mesorhizobium sp. M0323 TaxID=2956938 RepID=UPI00333589D2
MLKPSWNNARGSRLLSLFRSYADRITTRRVTRKLDSYGDWLRALTLTLLPTRKAHHCNACDRGVAAFYRFGRYTLICPLCHALDRERFLICALDRKLLGLPAGPLRILQIAPSEKGLSKRLSQAGNLIKGDIEPGRYGPDTVQVDLMNMNDISDLDIVVLCHVMEHVPDDRHAFRQIWSSLKPQGQVWIQVPLIYRQTLEATPSMSRSERDERFGGSDHVRAYGPDIKERIEDVGFTVARIHSDRIPAADRERLGLLPDTLFIAERPEQHNSD